MYSEMKEEITSQKKTKYSKSKTITSQRKTRDILFYFAEFEQVFVG